MYCFVHTSLYQAQLSHSKHVMTFVSSTDFYTSYNQSCWCHLDSNCDQPTSITADVAEDTAYYTARAQLRVTFSNLEGHFCCLKPLCPSATVVRIYHITTSVPIGRHYTLLGFRLFPTGARSSAAISIKRYVTHPVVFTVCYHPRVTLTYLRTQKCFRIS